MTLRGAGGDDIDGGRLEVGAVEEIEEVGAGEAGAENVAFANRTLLLGDPTVGAICETGRVTPRGCAKDLDGVYGESGVFGEYEGARK